MAHYAKGSEDRGSSGIPQQSEPRSKARLGQLLDRAREEFLRSGESAGEEEFQPRTPLGRRLWELRKQIVASGEPLLDWDGIEREVAERRGGVSERDL